MVWNNITYGWNFKKEGLFFIVIFKNNLTAVVLYERQVLWGKKKQITQPHSPSIFVVFFSLVLKDVEF